MGSTADQLENFRVTEAGSPESVVITELPVFDVIASNFIRPDLNNLTLWSGSVELGSASGLMLVNSSTEEYIFYLSANPVIVPQGGSVLLTLKGDVGTLGSGAADDQTNILHVVPNGVTAVGQKSNRIAIVTGSATAHPQTVLRSTLGFSQPLSAPDSDVLRFRQISLPPLLFRRIRLVRLR